MEKKSGILQSKFVRILLVVVAAAAGIVGIIGNNAGEIAESAGEKQLAKLQEMIGPNAEIVIAPSTYSREIRILDGERGLFLALDGTYKIINTQGEVLADTGCTEIVRRLEDGRWIMGPDVHTDVIVDMEQVLTEGSFTMPEYPAEYDSIHIHESCEYYLVSNDKRDEVYSLPDNELIYKASGDVLSSEYGLRFTDRKGYASYTRADGKDCLLNIFTGETEYVCGENERLPLDGDIGNLLGVMRPFFAKDKPGGKNQNFTYFLDENYEVALDGAIFNSIDMIKISQEYRVAYLAQEANYYNVEEKLRDDNFISDAVTVVLNEHGEVVYKEDETHDGSVRTILGDVVVVGDPREGLLDYYDLTTGELLLGEEELLCFWDFEDGIAAAEALPKDFKQTGYEERRIDIPHLERLYLEGKCGFVDENMQPLTDFVFDSVTATDNGYAVVYVDDMPAVIRFKGAV